MTRLAGVESGDLAGAVFFIGRQNQRAASRWRIGRDSSGILHRGFRLHFVPSLSMRNACVFSFDQESSVTRESAPATPASCKIRDVRPTRSSSMNIVGMLGVLLLSLACSKQSWGEPVTVTFLDAGLQVKRLPAPDGSLNRRPVARYSSKAPPLLTCAGINVIWAGLLTSI